jgi:hypothetical protein
MYLIAERMAPTKINNLAQKVSNSYPNLTNMIFSIFILIFTVNVLVVFETEIPVQSSHSNNSTVSLTLH